MFGYLALLTRDYGLPVYPVALLSYDKPRDAEADVFRVVFPDKQVLEFHFTVLQLNRMNWRAYLRRDNPVASALMAKMGVAPAERVEVKKECLRMIVRLKLDPRKTRLLATFKTLPHKEQEKTMELMTSWEERGYQKGLQQGLQQSLRRERELVIRLLEQRIGVLSKRAQTSVQRLSPERLEDLGMALRDFTTARDLARWLREHPVARGNGHSAQSNGAQTSKKTS
jgi:hypothetical protein